MNKKIKVIELLNRIYENKDIPEKIKWNNIEYEYNDNMQEYTACNEGRTTYFFYNVVEHKYEWLDKEAEILEDEEEIDIQGIEEIREYRTSDDDLYNDNFGDFKSTINELVKAVKQLNKNKVDYIQPYKED